MAFAKELTARNIRVNTVAPGPTITEGSKAMTKNQGGKSKDITKMIPLGRLGTPEDIAKVVIFLASDASGWVTGKNKCIWWYAVRFHIGNRRADTIF